VGGLTGQEITEGDFMEWFRGVERVHFIVDKVTGKRRPFCYIDFLSPEHANDAMMYNGELFMGNRLKMRFTESSPRNGKRGRGRGRRGGKKNKNQKQEQMT
jgi:RNA recognition motif-containing protein